MPESTPVEIEPADIKLADLPTEPEPTDDAEEEEPTEPETEEEESHEDESEEEEETEEELSEDWSPEETDKYAFDESVLEGVPEEAKAKIKKRWQEQTTGLVKRESQLESRSKELEVLDSYATAFNDPKIAPDAFKHLATQIAGTLNVPVETLLGQPKPEGEDLFVDIRTQIRNELKAEMDKELAPLREEHERRKAQEELDSYVGKSLPAVQNYMKKLYGVQASRQELAEALKARPDLKSQPIKAYKSHFGAKIVDSQLANIAKTGKKRAPEMGKPGGRQESVMKDPADLTAADVKRMG